MWITLFACGIKWYIINPKWDKVGNMLLGEYIHKIDDKKRLTLPKVFIKELGGEVVITRGLDKSLFLYPKKEWLKVVEKIKELSFAQKDARAFSRFMLAGASEVSVDKSGRVLIPDHLKKFAALKSSVVLAGLSDRVEIWDENEWKKYTKALEENGDMLAEKLGEIGLV